MKTIERIDKEIKILERRLAEGDYGVAFSVSDVLERAKANRENYLERMKWSGKKYGKE